MTKTAVVILNWNGRNFLEKFLQKVIDFSEGAAEVIVADNASTDSSLEYLQDHFPTVRIVQNKLNYGFAKGYNEALKKIEAEYYILLNSDIEVTPNWIEPLIDFMDNNQKVAACQPKILDYYNKNQFEYAGAAGGFIDKYGYPFCRGRLFQQIEKDEGQYNEITEIFWATGACLFVRAEVYHILGGLDEDFFAHMEEIDFCWRLKNAGHQVYYHPESKIYHVGGGTLPKASAYKTYLNMRNNITMLYKNLPKNRLLKVFIARTFLDFVAAVRFLFSGGANEFWAVARAHLSFIKRFKYIKKKREQCLHNETHHIYQGNIVFEHYLKGKKIFTDLDSNKFS